MNKFLIYWLKLKIKRKEINIPRTKFVQLAKKKNNFFVIVFEIIENIICEALVHLFKRKKT